MITPRQVSVGTAAALLALVPAGVCWAVITNGGTAPVYYGSGSAVTTSSGHQVPAGATVSLPGFPGSSATTLYAISTAASQPVSVTLSAGD